MTKKKTIKILSLNIHKGFSLFNRKYTLDQIKTSIRDLGLDIVCLQEVMGEHTKHARVPQFEYLADKIWNHHAYGKNAIYTQGHHGNAILSHYKIASHENIDISTNRFERRGILHGILEDPSFHHTRLHVLTLHLDLLGWGRNRQLKRLCSRIEQIPKNEPLILCGDFNDWGEVSTEILEQGLGLQEVFMHLTGRHAATFPAAFPFLKLDRIYVRGLEIKNISCLSQTPWRELSDHLGLTAELGFNEKN